MKRQSSVLKTLKSDAQIQKNIAEIDALLGAAGLVRRRRGQSPGIARQLRMERAMPEELTVPAPEPRVAANGVEWLVVDGWAKMPWLWAGFSTRRGGVSRAYAAEGAPGEMNLGFTAADERAIVLENRRLLVEAVTGSLLIREVNSVVLSHPSRKKRGKDGAPKSQYLIAGSIGTSKEETPLVPVRQFHSNLVIRLGKADAGRATPWKADGAITDEPGILLAVQTADCIPVLVADRRKRVVGAFHAGWRGTVKRIVELGVGRMRLEFGSRPEDLVAAIGPGIGACCYAVGDEVLTEFESQFVYGRELFREVYDSDPVRTKYPMLFLTQRAPGHSPIGPSLHLDLTAANRRQLLDAGMGEKAISVVGGCTQCQPELFYSHRGSHGHAGRMMGVIGVRPR
ncbi:MAG TPA: peptidoglycan editing factor PgeF [Terracidiphilus sp.]|nr:peptidoglycan editing factor PgeF [Terracidiphilus sp.]